MASAGRLCALAIAAMLLACVVAPVAAFTILPAPIVSVATTTRSATRCDLFGGMMKDAFANDDSLGKRENAGLKKGPNYSEVTINGKAVKNAVAGQKVSQVAAAAGQKISYSCKKGDCATCEITMNGRIVKACQAKIPQGKCTITTF